MFKRGATLGTTSMPQLRHELPKQKYTQRHNISLQGIVSICLKYEYFTSEVACNRLLPGSRCVQESDNAGRTWWSIDRYLLTAVHLIKT
jgi:hypothetical protein